MLLFNLSIATFLLQLSITVYDNSVMQVKGSTFLLWTLECFPGLSRLVDEAMSIEVSYPIIQYSHPSQCHRPLIILMLVAQR